MTSKYRSHCPLDCPDVCTYEVQVKDGKISKILGALDNPYTLGLICGKAQKMIKRIYSQDRITSPLRRKDGNYVKVSWEEALTEIAEKLETAKQKFGPTSVLFFTEDGSAGLLKALEERFFKAFGGATLTEGSLCWGAATGAQKVDFGEYRAHQWEDMLNSKTIILWGRNIAETNIHMVPLVREAQEKGANVIVIDPIKTKTAAFADQHIVLRPGMDGIFALSVAHVILQQGWGDLEFVAKYTDNFEAYVHEVKKYPPEEAEKLTGVPAQTIFDFARIYAKSKPACVWLGYGMQRYNNAGQTIRAIDALGAIAGNLGIKGGGVNHASKYGKKLLQDISGDEFPKEIRLFKKATLAEEILNANPALEVLIVTSANPVTQLPNTAKTIEAFNKIPFKVVSDFFLTDTARLADIVLPCASVFEKEDVIMSSWNPFIGYNPKVVEPRGEAKADYEIFMELARIMGLPAYEDYTPAYWLTKALAPAREYGITLEALQQKQIKNPLWKEVAWEEKNFATENGKFKFIEKFDLPKEREGIRLLTPHQAGTMHSQFYNLTDNEFNYPIVHLSVNLADQLYLRDLDKVVLENQNGQLTALVKVSDDVHPECVVLHEGSWLCEGGGVNILTGDYLSDIGNGTSYNEVYCQLRKIT